MSIFVAPWVFFWNISLRGRCLIERKVMAGEVVNAQRILIGENRKELAVSGDDSSPVSLSARACPRPAGGQARRVAEIPPST